MFQSCSQLGSVRFVNMMDGISNKSLTRKKVNHLVFEKGTLCGGTSHFLTEKSKQPCVRWVWSKDIEIIAMLRMGFSRMLLCSEKETPPENIWHVPWKSMVGRCSSHWNSPFLGDLLIFGRVNQVESRWYNSGVRYPGSLAAGTYSHHP